MLLQIALIVASLFFSQGLPVGESPPQAVSRNVEPKQLLYVSERQQYRPEYDLGLLDAQFHVPGYNFIGQKQNFPRIQPQIILYQGGPIPGQPFLLQPGAAPGNFLIPQGGPNVILREQPSIPPRPVFVAGYPKPAHIPPIEKDAEEIPTNPSKIPPLVPKENKPEKLETFNEDEPPKKTATEADVLAAADRNPAYNPKTNLRPGQRFFILNGQPLFSNYPYNNQIFPGINPNLKFANVGPNFNSQPPIKTFGNYPSIIVPSEQETPATRELNGIQLQQNYPENLVLLNQPGRFQEEVFRAPFPANLEEVKDDKFEVRENFDDIQNNGGFGAIQFRRNKDQDDDAVVIDAGDGQYDAGDDNGAEVVSAAETPSEPTIAQAQPGAIALAGPGGVAAAAPRGTAFVGKEGLAISSPQATAVAGPSRDDEPAEEKLKMKKKKQR